MSDTLPDTVRTVVVVGASLAGHATARALRAEGFTGEVVVIGDEPHRPYDRPPLSKQFLLGTFAEPDLRLEDSDEDLGVEWVLGSAATALDTATHTVTLDNGAILSADAVVIATGSRARRFSIEPMAGVHRLRSLDDAAGLRADLQPGKRLVIVGGGLIGSEVAAAATSLGVEVTVVEADPMPLLRTLGPVVGRAMADLHARHGVRTLCNTGVRALVGIDRVEAVELHDGTRVDADVVVEAIGSLPNVEWLAGSGLGPLAELAGGVRCSGVGRTVAPGVYAVGDCAAWFDAAVGRHVRVEHWTDSMARAATVARTLLADAAERAPDEDHPAQRPPYFWSDQYDVRIQFAGRCTGAETFTVEQGSADTLDLLGVYRRGEDPVAVVALNQPRAFGRWRRSLMTPVPEVATA